MILLGSIKICSLISKYLLVWLVLRLLVVFSVSSIYELLSFNRKSNLPSLGMLFTLTALHPEQATFNTTSFPSMLLILTCLILFITKGQHSNLFIEHRSTGFTCSRLLTKCIKWLEQSSGEIGGKYDRLIFLISS